MDAVILSIGSEVVTGQVADTNAQWAARELLRAGIPVTRISAVDDLPEAIVEAVTGASAPDRLVWMTGGLGPTKDDITVDSVARALGVAVTEDSATRERIRAWYASRNRPLTEGGIRQARVPLGAEAFPNPVGSAPGIMIEREGCVYVMLPGVPAEMMAIARESAIPRLASRGRPGAMRIYRMAGVPEGGVDERLRDLWNGLKDNERFALQIGQGEVILRAVIMGEDGEECRVRLSELDGDIRRILGSDLYGTDWDSLEGTVIRLLGEGNLDLATAESVTGGIIAARLTAVPGASARFHGGMVAYRDPTKTGWLGVDPGLVAGHGTVSRETAAAMAEAARFKTGAAVGLATTGWAGPDGGDDRDPVGTVYVGIDRDGEKSVHRYFHRGTRSAVREYAATFALDLLRRSLCK